MDPMFAFIMPLFTFFLAGSAGNAFTETDSEGELLLSLYRGFLLAGFLSFIVYLYPRAYGPALFFYLALAVFGIKKSLWFKTESVPQYLFFFVYVFLWQCLFPFYYGAAWYGDWFEHYERVLFFLNERPPHHSFLGMYSVLARTPLSHLVQAFVMRFSGISFFYYQGLSTLLNTLFFFPFYFFLKQMNKQRFIFLLYLSPYILRMATYTFPKAFAAFFVLCAFYFYLCEGKNKKRTIDIGLLFGCAVMAHQSAFFYFAALCLLLLYHRRWRDFSTVSFFAAIPVSVWVAYGVLFFSTARLFGDTPVFSYGLSNPEFAWLQSKLNNLAGAFIPFVFLRDFYSSLVMGLNTNSYAFYTLWDRWQNFAYGGLPAVWALSLTFYVWKNGKRETNYFPKEILLFVVPFAFFCDVLSVNNTGVPIGVAQNGMMPLVLLLGLYGIGCIQDIPKKVLICIFIEYLAGFAVFYGFFLFPYYVDFLTLFYKSDASLAYSHHLKFLFDYFGNICFVLWGAAVLWGYAVLRKLPQNQT